MEIVNTFTRGTDLWGVLEHLIHYKKITVRELCEAPFKSNAPNKLIQNIKEYFEQNPQYKIALTFEWKRNPVTNRNFKEFFLREVA